MYKGTARPFMGQWRSVDVFKSLDSVMRAKKKVLECACMRYVCMCECLRPVTKSRYREESVIQPFPL